MKKTRQTDPQVPERPAPYRVRLPGFIPADAEEAGLGDVISRVTQAAGIRPCGGCARRASRWNRWIVFTR